MSYGTLLTITLHYRDAALEEDVFTGVDDVFLENGGVSIFYKGQNCDIIPIDIVGMVKIREQEEKG